MIVRRSNLPLRVLMLMAAAALLSHCTAAGMSESLSPSMGGLPANAPSRPAEAVAFPAVHDMPPPRNDTPLTEEQQAKLERDLSTLRTRTESLSDEEPVAKKPAAKPAAKPPVLQAQ